MRATRHITERNSDMSLRIGSVSLKHGLMLAPMAGVTDRAYRNICRKHGAELVVTEMVSAKALHYNDASSFDLASLLPYENNSFVQLFGHEPEILSEAVSKVCTIKEGTISPLGIDINMGCPMKKIVNNGEGSALLKDPALIGRIVRALRDSTELPLTVKIRLGWDSSSINAVEVAQIAAENGADAITVHGRTREQMYCPEVNIDAIADVKASVDIPVIANGGIFTVDDAVRMLDATKCDGIMLGRGTMGNPWLFEEIAARLEGKQYVLPDIDVRLTEAMTQVEEMILDKGEHTGVLEARRHLSYYIKNIKGASSARHRLNFANTKEELYCIVNEFINK